jgi:hypothetical protein
MRDIIYYIKVLQCYTREFPTANGLNLDLTRRHSASHPAPLPHPHNYHPESTINIHTANIQLEL